MKSVTIYSDGACSGNPGPGGWGTILMHGERTKEISGGEPVTTSNRMEITAAIKGLSALKEPCQVELFTDSNYLKNGASEWLRIWKRKNWITKTKQPVKNEDLWKELDRLISKHRISWHWLKGHAGHVHNERCDLLARKEINKLRKQFSPVQLAEMLADFNAKQRAKEKLNLPEFAKKEPAQFLI